MDGEDFVREILLGAMRMRAIVGGEDLRFGKAGAVNAIKLKTLGERLHFSVYIIPKETEAGEEISSSLIREALAAGDMEKANILLGMPIRRGRCTTRKRNRKARPRFPRRSI